VLLALGDVADDGGEERPTALPFQFGDRDFGGELGAVLAEAEDGPPLGHQPGDDAGAGEFRHVAAVPGVNPRRYQQLQRFPQDFGGRVAKDRGRPAVEEDDLLRLVHRDDAVLGNVENVRQPLGGDGEGRDSFLGRCDDVMAHRNHSEKGDRHVLRERHSRADTRFLRVCGRGTPA
jgi:hypothetical protein